MHIKPIKALHDNYIWCLHNETNAWVVDPATAEDVVAELSKHNLTLQGILITHHHWDHTDGIEGLKQAFPNIAVIGPNNPNISGLTQTATQDDNLELTGLNVTAQILSLPGHTLDHIGFHIGNAVFCGDTLFSGGCGRLFEGTATQMHTSLKKLVALGESTQVYCTHEYTLANLQFALAVEPNNQALQQYQAWCQQQRQMNRPTLPSSIAQELAINPFLRTDKPNVITSLTQCDPTLSSDQERFAALRQWKDNF